MAVHIHGIFEESINDKIKSSKILVVGAGGIGCELLKNLVLTGFELIHIIDLDTIELSNLNRQFLFHKQHIGRPKSVVAKESVLKFNPKAQITTYHDSITNDTYSVEFFRQFSAVASALDNVAARSHVNRMCLAADVPLIESGTAGYVGQITVLKKKISECYECLPRMKAKTYPGCTIRNTPSEPVHCIVWAKHLFNQLFGEWDADEDVSPDMADPHLNSVPSNDGNICRISTREWAKESNYDPVQIFNKLFGEDIDYLNRMNDLWASRKRPQRLNYSSLPDEVPGTSQGDNHIKDQVIWSIEHCRKVFCNSLTALKQKSEDSGSNSILIWDKDDDDCIDFVVACANLRSYCFWIPLKSRFDVKAIAGNIVPAIATTNAVIAGLIVLQMIKVLQGDFSKCRTAWLKECANGGKILPSSRLELPNPKCIVCSPTTPEVSVQLNLNTFKIQTLSEKILKEKLHMAQPDAMENATGKILLSSDEDDMADGTLGKTFSELGVTTSCNLLCEDYLQHYQIILNVVSNTELKDQEFLAEINENDILEQQAKKEDEKSNANVEINECETIEDDIVMLDTPISPIKKPLLETKRKISDDENGVELYEGKRRKTVSD